MDIGIEDACIRLCRLIRSRVEFAAPRSYVLNSRIRCLLHSGVGIFISRRNGVRLGVPALGR